MAIIFLARHFALFSFAFLCAKQAHFDFEWNAEEFNWPLPLNTYIFK